MAASWEKSWQQSLDLSYTSTTALDYTRAQLWYLKAQLLGQVGALSGSGLWTVYQSCDGAGNFGTPGDAVDRWGGAVYTPANIVRAGAEGTAHSWFVLKSPATMNGLTFYFVITFLGASDAYANFYMSKTAPTGGSNIQTPIATGGTWYLGTSSSPTSVNVGTAIANLRPNIILSSTGDFYYFPVQAGQGLPSLRLPLLGQLPHLELQVLLYERRRRHPADCPQRRR
jgi:hypothetical protein